MEKKLNGQFSYLRQIKRQAQTVVFSIDAQKILFEFIPNQVKLTTMK